MPEGYPVGLPERPSQNPGLAALVRAWGPPHWQKHVCIKRMLVLHSVSHPRTKRGARVSSRLAGHVTSDLDTGVGAGWFLGT